MTHCPCIAEVVYIRQFKRHSSFCIFSKSWAINLINRTIPEFNDVVPAVCSKAATLTGNTRACHAMSISCAVRAPACASCPPGAAVLSVVEVIIGQGRAGRDAIILPRPTNREGSFITCFFSCMPPFVSTPVPLQLLECDDIESTSQAEPSTDVAQLATHLMYTVL